MAGATSATPVDAGENGAMVTADGELSEAAAAPEKVDPRAEFGLDSHVKVRMAKAWFLFPFLSFPNSILCVLKQNMVSMERDALKGGDKDKVNLQSLPVRGYLDRTVTPIVLDAFAALARER